MRNANRSAAAPRVPAHRAGEADEAAAVCREVPSRLLPQGGLTSRADGPGPAMLVVSPPLVGDREGIGELLGIVDVVLTGAESWLASWS